MATNTFDILERVIDGVDGKPGWCFDLIDDPSQGYRLRICDTKCVNSYTGEPFALNHYFPVPTATYNEASWRRWVFDCCIALEHHEVGEWLRWNEERPFAPMHGPGENPYVINVIRSDDDARTTQDGSKR